MTMSELVTKIDGENFETEVLRSKLPVLVDCWASWCRPCLAMVPVLESAAEQGASVLKVVKINVEANKALSDKLKVGALPTFMIFRDGNEVARRTGSMPASKLQTWLAENGVGNVTVPEPPVKEELACSAFYGDAELLDFFFNRLKTLAKTGSVRHFRFPTWSGEDGTPAASLVHSDKPDVFERLTGIPYSFACAMEFAAFTSEGDIDQLHAALKAGADLESVAPALVREWFLDPEIDWITDLDGDSVGPLKDRWVEFAGRQLRKDPPSPAEWTKLREELTATKSVDDPYRGNADSVATMLIKLSPPPTGEGSADTWVSALLLNGTSIQARMAWRRAGWTKEDIAQEPLFYRWAKAREAAAPGGVMPDEERYKLGDEWRRDHQVAGYDQKQADFRKNWDTYHKPIFDVLRRHLVKLVARAPK
jgi:thioredoxin 1